jgi:hypothetical protein
MNIQETRTMLSLLWASRPSAPKLTDADKMRTVLCYFQRLHGFAFDDVMNAIGAYTLPFIPSADEIAERCSKTLQIERFLSNEYLERMEELRALDERLGTENAAFESAFKRRCALSELKGLPAFDAHESEYERLNGIVEDYWDLLATRRALAREVHALEIEAMWAAEADYDAKQRKSCAKDMEALGSYYEQENNSGYRITDNGGHNAIPDFAG